MNILDYDRSADPSIPSFMQRELSNLSSNHFAECNKMVLVKNRQMVRDRI